jgi:hypothetical protein
VGRAQMAICRAAAAATGSWRAGLRLVVPLLCTLQCTLYSIQQPNRVSRECLQRIASHCIALHHHTRSRLEFRPGSPVVARLPAKDTLNLSCREDTLMPCAENEHAQNALLALLGQIFPCTSDTPWPCIGNRCRVSLDYVGQTCYLRSTKGGFHHTA